MSWEQDAPQLRQTHTLPVNPTETLLPVRHGAPGLRTDPALTELPCLLSPPCCCRRGWACVPSPVRMSHTAMWFLEQMAREQVTVFQPDEPSEKTATTSVGLIYSCMCSQDGRRPDTSKCCPQGRGPSGALSVSREGCVSSRGAQQLFAKHAESPPNKRLPPVLAILLLQN